MQPERIRLQKLLAARAVASRRTAEGLIAAGRVAVNGILVTQMGSTVDPVTDAITVDGAPLANAIPSRTIMLHKPPGYVCSTNAGQGRTIYTLLQGISERLLPIGRLDKDSEGLLLLTTDGELANRLMHPRYEHEKVYRVLVAGKITPARLRILNGPMKIETYTTRPARVACLPSSAEERATALEFVLREGRNRQIRRMCEQVGLRVTRLVRTAHAGIQLGALPAGKWRNLTAMELALLEA